MGAGNKYVGGFRDGKFHGKGVLHMAGGGKYVATWHDGKEVQGHYEFADQLQYKTQNWKVSAAGLVISRPLCFRCWFSLSS